MAAKRESLGRPSANRELQRRLFEHTRQGNNKVTRQRQRQRRQRTPGIAVAVKASRGFRSAPGTLKQSTKVHSVEETCLPRENVLPFCHTMGQEKRSGAPEVCSVTSTVDAQRDASTKSLVSRKVSVDKDLRKLMIK